MIENHLQAGSRGAMAVPPGASRACRPLTAQRRLPRPYWTRAGSGRLAAALPLTALHAMMLALKTGDQTVESKDDFDAFYAATFAPLCAQLYVLTGNIEGAAHIKISRAGLGRYFLFGGYGSDSSVRSDLTLAAIARAEALHGHDVDPADVMVVGDTPRDVEAAHGAGAIAVGVATGEFTVGQLADAGAEHVLNSFEEDAFPTLS